MLLPGYPYIVRLASGNITNQLLAVLITCHKNNPLSALIAFGGDWDIGLNGHRHHRIAFPAGGINSHPLRGINPPDCVCLNVQCETSRPQRIARKNNPLPSMSQPPKAPCPRCTRPSAPPSPRLPRPVSLHGAMLSLCVRYIIEKNVYKTAAPILPLLLT